MSRISVVALGRDPTDYRPVLRSSGPTRIRDVMLAYRLADWCEHCRGWNGWGFDTPGAARNAGRSFEELMLPVILETARHLALARPA